MCTSYHAIRGIVFSSLKQDLTPAELIHKVEHEVTIITVTALATNRWARLSVRSALMATGGCLFFENCEVVELVRLASVFRFAAC